MHNFSRLIGRLRDVLGLDRAIAASSATQLIRLVTGPITMVLIIRFLSPIEQGYYYSFAGVVGIQVFLEAGFSVSIAQFAAKEFAGLRFTNKELLTGNPRNLSRLRSIFHKANRYYTAMALVLTTVLAVGGYFFFASRPADGVSWETPWVVISVCAGLNFLLTPFWAVLEGCNRVADISIYRFGSTLVGFGATAVGMVVSQSVWVVIWGSIAGVLVAYGYLGLKWFPFAQQLLRRGRERHQIDWFKEIWGFQWRIASVWGFKYMLFPMTPALAFALLGPVEAGQIGLCYQLAFTGGALATTWTVTKIPYWGTLLAKENELQFSSDWRRASKKHIGIAFLTQGALLAVVYAIHLMGFGFSHRFLSPLAVGGFALGIFFHSFWLIFSHYFRAKREEPFVSVTIIASITFVAVAWLTSSFGTLAITYSFALANLIGAVGSYIIWKKLK